MKEDQSFTEAVGKQPKKDINKKFITMSKKFRHSPKSSQNDPQFKLDSVNLYSTSKLPPHKIDDKANISASFNSVQHRSASTFYSYAKEKNLVKDEPILC